MIIAMSVAGAAASGEQVTVAAPRDWSQPLVVVTACWLLGLALGQAWNHGDAWLVATAPPLLMVLVMALRRRWRGVRCWSLVALVPLAAAYLNVRLHHVPDHHIRLYADQRSQLVQVTGTVASVPVFTTSERGAFAAYSFTPPRTLFVMDAQSLTLERQQKPVRGRMLVKIEQVDRSLARGDRIQATGWLSSIDGPSNPGEFDYRAYLARDDIHARLTLPTPANYRALPGHSRAWWQYLRGMFAEQARRSLQLGMDLGDQRFAMLELVLLGSGRAQLGDLDEAFRRTGLTHLLSISGAHLAILMGMVWLVARVTVGDPPRAGLMAMAILLLYLMAVPMQVPVVRSGIMAGVFGVGFITGRRLRGLPTLALACLLALLWRPGDLVDPGFQLSFGAVAGLLTFSRPVSQWLWPTPLLMTEPTGLQRLARWAVDAVAANIVASAIVGPLVAQHFGMVTPMAIVLSFVALPVVTVTLGLGYLKILVGVVLPSAGLLLAGPLTWTGQVMAGLVTHASQWPGSTVVLDQAPGWAWTLGGTALVVAVFAGWFANRRATLAAAVALCATWLAVGSSARSLRDAVGHGERQPAAVLNVFSVGNGSCLLLRLDPGAQARQPTATPFTLMFDCGSQEYLDVGSRSIAPALRTLGVTRVDVLVVSHADIDHFGGSLDLIDALPVGEVWMSPQMLNEARADLERARQKHTRPPAHSALVEGLTRRGVEIRTVSQGLSRRLPGGAQLDVLWPAPTYQPRVHNDQSVVLSVRVAGRRILFNGDIQKQAIPDLLAGGIDLSADVVELPHHGSFVESSPRWLEAVRPRLVLQSSGWQRLESDPWPEHLQRLNIARFITATQGMGQLTFEADGAVKVTAWDGDDPPDLPPLQDTDASHRTQ
jgi:competence protein ComEC